MNISQLQFTIFRTELQQIKDELTQVKQEMKEEYIATRNASQEGEYMHQISKLYSFQDSNRPFVIFAVITGG